MSCVVTLVKRKKKLFVSCVESQTVLRHAHCSPPSSVVCDRRAAIPVHYRTLRAVLYGASVFLSCFLMLVFMTYNVRRQKGFFVVSSVFENPSQAYLIFAVVAGAAIGHYLYSGFVEPDSKGVSCH